MARSGRSVSNRDNRSSGQPRSWSASDRYPSLAIPPTLGSAAAVTQVELHHGAATDVGLLRETNEDAYLVAPPVFVVADGMGGHENGDVASRIVVEEFARLADEGYEPTERHRGRHARRSRPASAGSRSTPRAGGRGQRRTPGTTVVAALLVEDARRARPGCWPTSATRASTPSATASCARSAPTTASSRSWSTPARSPATQAADHPERHVITRALGGPRLEPADFFLLPVAEVERLLLCSDGISGLVDDDQIAADPDRDARPARRRRPAGRGRPARPGATTTPPRSWSMWWDWSPTRPTTPSDSERVSSRNWEHCRERSRRSLRRPCVPTCPATGSGSSASAPW